MIHLFVMCIQSERSMVDLDQLIFYFMGISLNTQLNQFYIYFHLIQPERGMGELNYIYFKSSHLVAC